ncbi:MAG TPA: hypothetical protein PLP23_12555 [Panacibacter sp.]|nr:hypothetical protein [Panacibacter sp.]
MKTLSIILLSCFCFSGCKKDNNETYYLKAKVIFTRDIACNLPVLDFSEDSIRLRSLTQLAAIDYSVINLPSVFNIQDKKLYVSVAILKPEEEFPCNDLGIGYPHLKIINVKAR